MFLSCVSQWIRRVWHGIGKMMKMCPSCWSGWARALSNPCHLLADFPQPCCPWCGMPGMCASTWAWNQCSACRSLWCGLSPCWAASTSTMWDAQRSILHSTSCKALTLQMQLDTNDTRCNQRGQDMTSYLWKTWSAADLHSDWVPRARETERKNLRWSVWLFLWTRKEGTRLCIWSNNLCTLCKSWPFQLIYCQCWRHSSFTLLLSSPGAGRPIRFTWGKILEVKLGSEPSEGLWFLPHRFIIWKHYLFFIIVSFSYLHLQINYSYHQRSSAYLSRYILLWLVHLDESKMVWLMVCQICRWKRHTFDDSWVLIPTSVFLLCWSR